MLKPRLPKSAIQAAALGAVFALGIAIAPSDALACNPDDCKGISKEELARDKAEIRRLNREQLRRVRQPDARYAEGWDATRRYPKEVAAHQKRLVVMM